ncbi:AMP-binding protein [Cumulibacter manganitolerans]|uniref:AMP-binding protein n=1 Tax=Cumulibacter manganitolerans TaxID=1884992 RepID=UPI001295F600|nr:AMP-binding protein [Cumulibacter manganitolerans]
MTWWTVAQEHPERVAIIDGERALTFGALRSVVNRIAASWDDLGVGPGDAVAAVLPNCAELLTLELAALCTGRYFVPINRHLTSPEVAYILGNSRPALVLTSDDLLPTVTRAAADAGVPAADRVFSTGGGERAFSRVWTGRADADPQGRTAGSVLLYSSGTTGKPKGIRRTLSGLTPEQEIAGAGPLLELLRLGPGPGVHAAVAPLYHSAPNSMAVGALNRGVTVACPPGGGFDADGFLDFATEVGMTESFMVPTMFVRLLRLPDDVRAAFDPRALRSIVHAGAPCPVHVKRQMIQWWGPVLEEFYGSTESSAVTTVHSDEWLEAPGTVGRARAGYEIQIRDAAGTPVPAGEEGLIYSVGSQRFDYVGDPDKTRASWDDDALLIGDVGRLDEDGRLFLLDRRTDLILSGGVNVYPAEIEATLLEHSGVDDVAVVGLPDDEWGQRVVAVVAPAGQRDHGELIAELERFATPRLARFKRPREYRIVEAIPRMPTGKISRSAIRESVLQE